MGPEEIKKIVESAIQDGLGFIWWHYLIVVILICGSFFIEAYFKRKGQDLATRENIEDLTSLVESVKKDIRDNESIAQAKRQMMPALKHCQLLILFLSLFHRPQAYSTTSKLLKGTRGT